MVLIRKKKWGGLDKINVAKAIDFSSPLTYIVLTSVVTDLLSLHGEELFLPLTESFSNYFITESEDKSIGFVHRWPPSLASVGALWYQEYRRPHSG